MSYLDIASIVKLRKHIVSISYNGDFPLVIPSAPSNLVEYMDNLARTNPKLYEEYTKELLKLFRTTERAIKRVLTYTSMTLCQYGLSNLALYSAVIRGSETNDHMDVACRLNTAIRAFSIMSSVRRMLDYEAKTHRGRLPSRTLCKRLLRSFSGIPNSGTWCV